MVSKGTQTVSTSTSEATVGSKRKREPEPALEPAPEPSPEPAGQGFYWDGLPLEVKQNIFKRVCTLRVSWGEPFDREHANDTALSKSSVSKEFDTCLWEHHKSVFDSTHYRSNQADTYLLHKIYYPNSLYGPWFVMGSGADCEYVPTFGLRYFGGIRPF